MTAYVTIPVATVENVAKIPNAALRFKPPMSPEAVRAIYAQHGIDPSKGRDEAATPESSSPANTRRRAREETAVVWKLLGDGTVEPIALGLGLTDHAYTEVTRLITGTLKPGDEVVTSSIASKGSGPGQGIRR